MKLFLLLSIITLSLCAMQSNQDSYFDLFPPEIVSEVGLFLFNGNGEGDTLTKLKKVYTSSKKAAASIEITKTLFNYLIERDRMRPTEITFLQNKLNEFAVFKKQEIITWFEEQKIKLLDEAALRDAAYSGNIQKIKTLLEKKININSQDNTGKTALHKPFWSGLAESIKLEIAKLLIEKGADANIKCYKSLQTPLHRALIQNSSETIITLLLNAKADPNSQNIMGGTPLMLAVSHVQANIIPLLLTAGAQVNIVSKNNMTALLIAVFEENFNQEQMQKIQLLLQAGANPNLGLLDYQSKKFTALQYTRDILRNEDLEKLLIRYGAYDSSMAR
jgi:ankyrin repeat protein